MAKFRKKKVMVLIATDVAVGENLSDFCQINF